jgi:hypothetical protein
VAIANIDPDGESVASMTSGSLKNTSAGPGAARALPISAAHASPAAAVRTGETPVTHRQGPGAKHSPVVGCCLLPLQQGQTGAAAVDCVHVHTSNFGACAIETGRVRVRGPDSGSQVPDAHHPGYGMRRAHCAESVYCWNETMRPSAKR